MLVDCFFYMVGGFSEKPTASYSKLSFLGFVEFDWFVACVAFVCVGTFINHYWIYQKKE